MKKSISVIALLSFYFLFVQSLLSAGAFMKLGDIKGEAIEIQSVRWMAPESIRERKASGAASSKSGELTLTKYIDKSSTKLAEMANSGGVIEAITIAEGEKNYLLTNVKVVSVEKKGKQEVVNLRYASKQPIDSTRAAAPNHNSTRSNKTKPVQNSAPAQDYNSSRSNKSSG